MTIATITAMDVDKSQIGRYGTVSLLKQQDTSVVVAEFGIDTEEISFGRDRNCSVRLYYPDVDPVHCKIIFEERKVGTLDLLTNFLTSRRLF